MAQSTLPPQAQTLADWLGEKRAAYEMALARQKDGTFDKRQGETLEKIRSVVRFNDISSEQALVMLGRIQQILSDSEGDELLIQEYESKKKSIRLYTEGQ